MMKKKMIVILFSNFKFVLFFNLINNGLRVNIFRVYINLRQAWSGAD